MTPLRGCCNDSVYLFGTVLSLAGQHHQSRGREHYTAHPHGYLAVIAGLRTLDILSRLVGAGIAGARIAGTIPQRRDNLRFSRAANGASASLEAFLGTGGFLGNDPLAEAVAQRRDVLCFGGLADGAGTGLAALLGAGGFLSDRPLTKLVSQCLNGSGFLCTANGANTLLAASFSAGSLLDGSPLTESMGDANVRHVVQPVLLVDEAVIRGQSVVTLLGGHAVPAFAGGMGEAAAGDIVAAQSMVSHQRELVAAKLGISVALCIASTISLYHSANVG